MKVTMSEAEFNALQCINNIIRELNPIEKLCNELNSNPIVVMFNVENVPTGNITSIAMSLDRIKSSISIHMHKYRELIATEPAIQEQEKIISRNLIIEEEELNK